MSGQLREGLRLLAEFEPFDNENMDALSAGEAYQIVGFLEKAGGRLLKEYQFHSNIYYNQEDVKSEYEDELMSVRGLSLEEFTSINFYKLDGRDYLKQEALDDLLWEIADDMNQVKQYVIDQEGYEENSSQARVILDATDFTDLLARYAVMQERDELRDALAEVQGETQSPGLADVEVQRNTEKQSKVRKI